MAKCPECGTFVWDNQTLCNNCGTDLVSGEKRPRTEEDRPQPLPVHPRTPIGQKRQKPTGGTSSAGLPDKTRIGQRRGVPGESDRSAGQQPDAGTPLRRTRVGQVRSMDGGIAAGFQRRSYSDTGTVGEIFSETFKTMVKNPLILVPSVLPMIWSVTAAFSGVIGFTGLLEIGEEDSELDTIITEFALWAILSLLIAFWSYAATIRMFGMANQKKHFSLLFDGILTAMERTLSLLTSGLIFAIIVTIGSIFFVIPGIIAFVLMFLFVQAIMIDDEGATSSLSKSMDVVRTNPGTAIVIFLAILIIPVLMETQSSLATFLPAWATWGNFLIAGVSLIAEVYVIGLATTFYLNKR